MKITPLPLHCELWFCILSIITPIAALDAQDVANAVFPSGLVIDITQSPYNAAGDGTTDDTAAFQAALESSSTNKVRGSILYIPDGTYLVSDSIIAGVTESTTQYINIQGQSRDGTIIKLATSATGFGDTGNPKPIISFFEGTTGHNDGFTNHIHNVTIDANNNAGAVALRFESNNTGSIRNVRLMGDGYIGLDLKVRLNGLGLIKDLTVDDYDIGVDYADSTSSDIHNGFVFKNLTLNNQNTVGLQNGSHWVAIDGVTSDNSVPAIKQLSDGGMMTILRGAFTGGSSGNTAIEIEAGHVFVRDSYQDGYQYLLDDDGTTIANLVATEYASDAFATGSSPSVSTNLIVPDLPAVAWDDPADWVVIDGQANGNLDDAPAIQAAIDNGATTISFSSEIDLRTTLYLRGSLRRVYGNWQEINIRNNLRQDPNAFSIVIEDTDGPLVISNWSTKFSGTPKPRLFLNENSEDVIFQDCFFVHQRFYKSGEGPLGRLFLENTHTMVSQMTDPNLTDAPEGNLYWFIDQEVYGWGVNPENTAPNMTIDGGKVVLTGVKFGESPGLHWVVKSGADAEILGGVVNVTADDPGSTELFAEVQDTADVSFVIAERATSRSGHTLIFDDTRDGDIDYTNFPARTATNGINIPLFVSRSDNSPVAVADFYSVDQDDVLVVSNPGVLTNDTETDGSVIYVDLASITGPSDGTLDMSVDGDFTYTPDSGFHGSDSFSYKAWDGVSLSASATVDITVNGDVILNPTDDKSRQSGDGLGDTERLSMYNFFYTRFDLSSISSVSTATLRIYRTGADNRTYYLAESTEDNWTETDANYPSGWITYQHSDYSATSGDWLEFDVTSFVSAQASGDGIATFVLKSNSGAWDSWVHSRQNSVNPPELIIE